MNKMSFQLISKIFSDFSFEGDQQTDRRTDRASYRCVMTRDAEAEAEAEAGGSGSLSIEAEAEAEAQF